MKRRDFLKINASLLAGMAFCHPLYASPIFANSLSVYLQNDRNGFAERLLRVGKLSSVAVYSDLQGRMPVTYRINVLDALTEQPLVGAQVRFFLADAFGFIKTESEILPQSHNTYSMASRVVEKRPMEIESCLPCLSEKNGHLIRYFDVVVVHQGKISVSRIEVDAVGLAVNDPQDPMVVHSVVDRARTEYQQELWLPDLAVAPTLEYGKRVVELTLLANNKPA